MSWRDSGTPLDSPSHRSSGSAEDVIKQLEAMGFTRRQIEQAIESTMGYNKVRNGDRVVNVLIEAIMSSSETPSAGYPSTEHYSSTPNSQPWSSSTYNKYDTKRTEENDSNLGESVKKDSVSSLSHEQSSNEEMSSAATIGPEPRAGEFSAHIKQYPFEEFKEFEGKSLIGTGGFGKVRKYHHNDKIVAIKEFAITGDEETITRIWNMVRREANILCCFQHENIVDILGITQWPNAVGIIMEFVDGGNLQNLLCQDDQSDLSWEARLDIASGITSGLDYIHNNEENEMFCHGDLKPANVLLTQSLQVKLADFGSAGLYRATSVAKTTATTQDSTSQFTVIYVAPEFLENNTKKKNPTMDMYSYAMVLYELISKKAPYSDSNLPMHVPALIMAKVKPSMKLIDNAESQLKIDDDRKVFSFLKKLMERCWGNYPASRPTSKTVKLELGRFMNPDGISAHIKQYPFEELKEFEGKSLIGSGGFGEVRKYHHKNKIVAVKEFAITGDEETIAKVWKMVRREANILQRFQHENIVEILGVTQWPNAVGIVMEFVDGGNLQNLLCQNDQSDLSWKARMDIASGITSGLDYIHNYERNKTFCHGDLKPANVLLTQSLQVKLADFGSAELYRATAASTTTKTKQVSTSQFTLIYVAPEFLEDNTKKRNPAMDMYSFALVLYELISGKAPYSDSAMPGHVPALIVANIKPSPKLINGAEKQLPTGDDRAVFSFLKKLMERCWGNNPASRPTSKTVKLELGRFMNGQEDPSSLDRETQSNVVESPPNKRKPAPTLKLYTGQGVKKSTSRSSASQRSFGSSQPSTSFGNASTKDRTTETGNNFRTWGGTSYRQTSSLGARFEKFLREKGGLGNSHRQTSSLEATMDELIGEMATFSVLSDNTTIQEYLAKYTDALLNSDFCQADTIKEALRLLMEDLNTEMEVVLLFAHKLLRMKKYLQAVAIFDTGAHLSAKMNSPEKAVERIQFCIQGMTQASENMVEKDPDTKMLVSEYMIPLMHNWLREMKSTSRVSEKWKCHTVTWALSNIERCERLVDQNDQAILTLEEAIGGMRAVFGDGVHHLHGRLFGTMLHNLGCLYGQKSRVEDAAELFKEAIKAHGAGADYFGDEEERSRDISISELCLKGTTRLCWERQLQRM